MPLFPFPELMRAAQHGKYAVGYFESWNLESLLAVSDAAESSQSPVLLGFSGIYLPHPERRTREHLGDYFALAHAVAARLSVPACLVFNESPHVDWLNRAIGLGFGLVMYANESPDEQSAVDSQQSLVSTLQSLVSRAHGHSVAVEAELKALAGVGGELAQMPKNLYLTDPDEAREFVDQTRIDALAVNVGQAHMHGRTEVQLDLERLGKIRNAVNVPLVLHGATSVRPQDLREAIGIGVQKINVGSALKRVYFETLKSACIAIGASYNPYEVMGSGLDADVLTTARLALQSEVENRMELFGSKGKAR